MKNLKAKLRKNGGFTLIEMLIVVAIIAILIAVSIPLVGNALEKAREATDAANERSFKGELITCYLTQDLGNGADKFTNGAVYVYDAPNGKLVLATDTTNANAIKAYGQGTAGGNGTDPTSRTGHVLYGSVSEDGTLSMGWDATGKTAVPTGGTLTSGLLVDTKVASVSP